MSQRVSTARAIFRGTASPPEAGQGPDDSKRIPYDTIAKLPAKREREAPSSFEFAHRVMLCRSRVPGSPIRKRNRNGPKILRERFSSVAAALNFELSGQIRCVLILEGEEPARQGEEDHLIAKTSGEPWTLESAISIQQNHASSHPGHIA